VATWNILHGADLLGRPNPDRFQQAVHSLDVDVLALQEVDRHQPRSGGLDWAGLAADAMGATGWRFAAALHGTSSSGWARAVTDDPSRPAYGIAMLSRMPLDDWRLQRLPSATPYPAPRLRPTWLRDEPRVCMTAAAATPVGRLDVATTHLSRVPGWAALQLHWLRHRAGADLLLGDMNLNPPAVGYISNMRLLARTATYPAHDPVKQIDHILGGSAVEPGSETRSCDFGLSDHRALVLDVCARQGAAHTQDK
jgi:endonuclease/exonuclease/phosphatase family metal-dependent hydrolase